VKVFGELEAAQFEAFTEGTKPLPAVYAQRVIWTTDSKIVYVSDGSQWIAVGASGASSLRWVEGPNTPAYKLNAVNNFETYLFAAGNILRTSFRVVRESTPKLRGFFFADSASTPLINVRAFLIRPGVTNVNGALTPNVDTDTLTVGAGDVNKPLILQFDLATANQINAVTLQTNDIILVEIESDPTNTTEFEFMFGDTEISFI
jgi:hypothetical protein